MSALLFQGQQEALSSGDAWQKSVHRRHDEEERTFGGPPDYVQPAPLLPLGEALAAAISLRPLTAPQPPLARPLISASSLSLGLSCSSARSLGLAKPQLQVAMERAARWGSRVPAEPVRPNLEDYALTGLRAYSPRRTKRSAHGYLQTEPRGFRSERTAHIHVSFPPTLGKPRPPAARGRLKSGRAGDQIGSGRELVPGAPPALLAASFDRVVHFCSL